MSFFSTLKHLITGTPFGGIFAFVLLTIYILFFRIRVHPLDSNSFKVLFIYTLRGVFILAFAGLLLTFVIIAFITFDNSQTSKIVFHPKTDTIYLPAPVIEKMDSNLKDSVAIKTGEKKYFNLQRNDTVYVPTNDTAYKIQVTLKENETYNELRAPLKITITQINLTTQEVNINFINTSTLENKILFLKNNSKGIFYTLDDSRYYLNFTNIVETNGIKYVDLNISKL